MGAKALQERLLEEAGVATVAGPSFGVHAGDFIRFSYANSVENIRRAIERMGTLLTG
jgi:aspartate/methionine/tyrosine aminotransferase